MLRQIAKWLAESDERGTLLLPIWSRAQADERGRQCQMRVSPASGSPQVPPNRGHPGLLGPVTDHCQWAPCDIARRCTTTA